MAAVRRSLGFRRFVLSLQYHGASFLGFTRQGDQAEKDAGVTSVESRLTTALTDLCGASHWENLQVSSRTDRGVHALENTLHIDIRPQWATTERLHRGLNFYLRRQQTAHSPEQRFDHQLRVVRVRQAPETMINPFHDPHDPASTPTMDWNARFSATQRTYLYRIVSCPDRAAIDWAAPFEWDRAWRIYGRHHLDVEAMQQAASYLVGEHDFSSFRGKGCQRSSPVTTLQDVQVLPQPSWLPPPLAEVFSVASPQWIHLVFRGSAFLYRQVRNLTGCLVEVGQGRMAADAVRDLLAQQSRAAAPRMAPAHGLFLVNVQHGDLDV